MPSPYKPPKYLSRKVGAGQDAPKNVGSGQPATKPPRSAAPAAKPSPPAGGAPPAIKPPRPAMPPTAKAPPMTGVMPNAKPLPPNMPMRPKPPGMGQDVGSGAAKKSKMKDEKMSGNVPPAGRRPGPLSQMTGVPRPFRRGR